MIPADENVNNTWAEFERYSTNDYVRQSLESQAIAHSNVITTESV